MEKKRVREIQKLTGNSYATVEVYFHLVEWGAGREDSAKVARLLERLGLQDSFKNGLPWWLPRIRFGMSLVMGAGYFLWTLFGAEVFDLVEPVLALLVLG